MTKSTILSINKQSGETEKSQHTSKSKSEIRTNPGTIDSGVKS